MNLNIGFFLFLIANLCLTFRMAEAQQKGRPNIIILYADDLGWNDISGEIPTGDNGSKNHQTSHIGNLSIEGVSFFYAYM